MLNTTTPNIPRINANDEQVTQPIKLTITYQPDKTNHLLTMDSGEEQRRHSATVEYSNTDDKILDKADHYHDHSEIIECVRTHTQTHVRHKLQS